MIKQTISVLAILGIGVAGIAYAQDRPGRHAMPEFQDIDQNNDALVSREEIEAFMQARADGRGKPGRDGENGHPMFEQADTDGDGYLSEAEFEAQLEERRSRRGGKRSHHRDHGCVGGADESA